MADDTSKTGYERKFLSLEQAHEIREWATNLGCTEEELRAAVKAVGNCSAKVRACLKAKQAP